jgi:hypothetical protein
MNGLPVSILLQHQNARAFGVLGIIFYDNRIGAAGKYLAHGQRIFRQLVISMVRNYYLPLSEKSQNILERVGHIPIMCFDGLRSSTTNFFSQMVTHADAAFKLL